MESNIHWKPMTGGRRIPSELPCITVEEFEDRQVGLTRYRYKVLNAQAFIVDRYNSDWPPRLPRMLPRHGTIELPVLMV